MQVRSLVILGFALAMVSSGCLHGAAGDRGHGAVKKGGVAAGTPGAPVPPGQYRFDGSFAEVLVPGTLKELPLQKTYLKSAVDGVTIEIGVWRPDVPEGTQVPVIVDAGPYYGNMGPTMEKKQGRLLTYTHNFVPLGFAVAAVSSRGTGQSGGCMDLMGNKEAADLSQAITWLGTQPWSNGNVGMTGKSYDGSTPWIVAGTGNPYLKTIVPVSGVPDVYGLMFRNGTQEIRGSFLLNAIYYGFAVPDSGNVPPSSPDEATRVATHVAQGVACPDHVVGLEASAYSGFVGPRDATGYWAERNNKPKVEKNYHGSVLLVQGLQDWNVDPALNIPWSDSLNRSGLFVHYILGQWQHDFPDTAYRNPTSPNMRWDWAEILYRWFSYWLKNETVYDLGPTAQVLDQTGRWHYDDSFPPHTANWTNLNLGAGSKLSLEAGAAGSVPLVPVATAYCVSQSPPVCPSEQLKTVPGYSADFYTAAQEKDLLISGLPKVHITVAPGGPTGHVAAWLYDVDEKNTATKIGWTMINLLFADGTEDLKPVTPGTKIVAKMEIQPMDAVVKAGHRLMLRVWQYRDDSGGADAQGRVPPVPTEPITLYYGGSDKSVLEIPTIDRGPEFYFPIPHPAAK